jgi:hypothetical protein
MTDTILFAHLVAVAVLISCLLQPAAAATRWGAERDRGREPAAFLSSGLRRAAWASLAVLTVTGLLMLSNWHIGLKEAGAAAFYQSRFGRLMIIKLLATAVLVIGLSSRRPANWLRLCFNLLVGLFVIVVSVHIVR